MGQTIIASPEVFSPAYNPLKFIVDSTNKSKSGFKYIFNIYEAGTTNKIAEYKVLPSYIDGFGEINLSKLIQSKVSWDLNTLSTSWYNAPNSYYEYDVKAGEEYTYQVTYVSNLTNNSGNVQINVSNIFNVGDQVVIIQTDGGVANPSLEGLHTVTASSGSAFTVNVAWSSVTNASIDGNVRFADNRKLILLGLALFNDQIAFNGAFRWTDWSTYDSADYKLTNSNKQWLTNQPQQFSCTLAEDLYLNLRSPKGHDRIVFVNSNGASFYKAISNVGEISQVPVGPNNYGTLTGTGALIDSTVDWYDVYYRTAAGVDSLKYRINLDRRESISEYDILFLDRLGSYSSFAFQLKSYERGEVTREIFNKDVKGYVNTNDNWTYNTEDMGFTQLNLNVVKSMDLNTNWMTQDMAQYFEELLTSPQTFIKKVTYDCAEGAISTTYQPCIVQNNTYEVFKQRNKNLIKQSITIKLSNQDNING
jgi:hypothetical protein